MTRKPTYKELENRIHELERAELAHEAAETDRNDARFELAFETANIAICLMDLDGRFAVVNEEMCRMYGYTKEEFGNMTSEDTTHPEDLDVSRRFIQRASSGEIDHERFTKRCIHKDGHVIWGDVSNTVVRGGQGDPLYFISFILDITENKKSEIALEESENRLNMVFEAAPDAYYINDYEGVFIDGNRAAEELLGYSREELIGKNFMDTGLLSTDQVEKAIRLFAENIDGRSTGPDQFALNRRDGTKVDVEISTHPVKIGDEDRVLGIARDITERKKLESQLRQAEKMEVVGTLAGGIAHEFNTLMTTVMGNADLALMSTGKDDPLREELEDIKSAGKRAADLTRQILAFSRKQMRQTKILDLNEVLADSEETLKHLITENVELKSIFESSLLPVDMDPNQIEQMVVNMVSNAGDAMPTGGTLTIGTANVDLDENFFRDLAVEELPGSYVMLSVTDTGSGMDAKTQEQMFDPFYTTREIGQGTGLGLSMVYGIVKQNEGVITVDSEIGQGTAFKIYLPVAKDDPETVKPDPAREDPPNG